MNDLSKARAVLLEVGEESAAQRIDNFLLRRLKGVPKSHVYRVLRSGEVRVNSGRVKPDYRVRIGDKVRVPPIRVSAPNPKAAARPFGFSYDSPLPSSCRHAKPHQRAQHALPLKRLQTRQRGSDQGV